MFTIIVEMWSDKGLAVTNIGPFRNRAAAHNWWSAKSIRSDENFVSFRIVSVTPPTTCLDRVRDFICDWSFDWSI